MNCVNYKIRLKQSNFGRHAKKILSFEHTRTGYLAFFTVPAKTYLHILSTNLNSYYNIAIIGTKWPKTMSMVYINYNLNYLFIHMHILYIMWHIKETNTNYVLILKHQVERVLSFNKRCGEITVRHTNRSNQGPEVHYNTNPACDNLHPKCSPCSLHVLCVRMVRPIENKQQ